MSTSLRCARLTSSVVQTLGLVSSFLFFFFLFLFSFFVLTRPTINCTLVLLWSNTDTIILVFSIWSPWKLCLSNPFQASFIRMKSKNMQDFPLGFWHTQEWQVVLCRCLLRDCIKFLCLSWQVDSQGQQCTLIFLDYEPQITDGYPSNLKDTLVLLLAHTLQTPNPFGTHT